LVFFVNALGPLTPLLKDELKLSYTVGSLHFSAFAFGTLAAGLGGQWLVNRFGRVNVLWSGAVGLGVGAWLLLIGLSPVITIGACLVMGIFGSFIVVLLPSAFAEQHHAHSAVALSEANVLASLIGASAPLLVGWSFHAFGGWRLPIGIVALAPLGIYAAFRTVDFPAAAALSTQQQPTRLPPMFWWYWLALFLSVAVEFCMLAWSADYLAHVYALPKTDAAQAVSLFLGGMILGRWASSRLVQRLSARRLVLTSLLLAVGGFGLFWQGQLIWVALGRSAADRVRGGGSISVGDVACYQ
jgi:MFS family permease